MLLLKQNKTKVNLSMKIISYYMWHTHGYLFNINNSLSICVYLCVYICVCMCMCVCVWIKHTNKHKTDFYYILFRLLFVFLSKKISFMCVCYQKNKTSHEFPWQTVFPFFCSQSKILLMWTFLRKTKKKMNLRQLIFMPK